MTLLRGFILLALCLVPALGQTPLEFEVASVKAGSLPAATDYEQGYRAGQAAAGLVVRGKRVDLFDQTLKDLVRIAYGVKAYQITGEKWMETEKYQITATLPAGSVTADAPQMLQTLLASRFHLVVRREPKELSSYALVVGKDGPKLKPADANPPVSTRVAETEADRRKAEVNVFIQNYQAEGSGTRRFRGQYTMSRLADRLTDMLDRPVFDQTNLDGRYDIDITYTAVDRADAGSGLISALPQLGLKLESRKLPVTMIAIEKADRVPVEN